MGEATVSIGRRLLAYRYALLGGALLVWMLFQTSGGFWIGDFWEHAAVVRELAAHPVAPRHPQLALDAPHAFFSPYTLGVALFASVTGLEPIAALSVAGIANLLLLLLGIRLFVSEAFDRGPEAIACYFLLFCLLLWGERPWIWSGFFHLGALGFVLAYPATFAAGLGFLGLAAAARCFRQRQPGWLAALLPLLGVVWLVHPNTALAVLIGASGLFVGFARAPWGSPLLALLGVWMLPLFVAGAWPYYDFFDLLVSQSGNRDFHRDSRVFYQDVLVRVFPALVGVPLLGLRLWRNPRDFLVWTFVGLAAVYASGAVSGRWGAGRVVSQLMLVLQLTIAAWVAGLESAGSRRWLLPVLLGVAAVPIATGNLQKSWAHATRSGTPSHARYRALAEYVDAEDVVVTGLGTGWALPTFAGRVIATQHPLYWVPDHDERRRALQRFFAPGSSHEERLEVIRRYGARFVLVDRAGRLHRRVRRDLLSLGPVVYRGKGLELIEVAQAPRSGVRSEP